MKKLLSTVICLVLILSTLCIAASAEGTRVFDYADLFTTEEEAALETQISSFVSETGMDFVVLTSDDVGSKESIEFADDFYDENGFGTGDDMSGILFFIDMDNRVPTISTCGAMIPIISDDRLNNLLDYTAYYNLVEADYAGAAEDVIDEVAEYVRAGAYEDNFGYDEDTGEYLWGDYEAYQSYQEELVKSIKPVEVVIALIIAMAVGVVVFFILKSSYEMKGSTYSYDVNKNSNLVITGHTDKYLRTSVVRTPKAPPPSSSGGGGGSHGSGVHMSGGGVSHGGGSGRSF